MLQSYGITIINSFLTAIFRKYLILPIQNAMIKLLTLAPSLRALRNYRTISKVRVIQKRLELQIQATAFWNLKTKRNLLIFKTKL